MLSQIIDNQNKLLLEKEQENAELKNKYDTCLRENTGLKIHNTYIEKKLTKAKELIKQLCLMVRELNNPNVQLTNVDYSLSEAEQFLKENE